MAAQNFHSNGVKYMHQMYILHFDLNVWPTVIHSTAVDNTSVNRHVSCFTFSQRTSFIRIDQVIRTRSLTLDMPEGRVCVNLFQIFLNIPQSVNGSVYMCTKDCYEAHEHYITPYCEFLLKGKMCADGPILKEFVNCECSFCFLKTICLIYIYLQTTAIYIK